MRPTARKSPCIKLEYRYPVCTLHRQFWDFAFRATQPAQGHYHLYQSMRIAQPDPRVACTTRYFGDSSSIKTELI